MCFLMPLIYFITYDKQEDAPIKIGLTNHSTVDSRLMSLQTASPFPLVPLATMIGKQKTERALHWLFREYRLNGEWFERSPLLLKYIKKVQHIGIADEAFLLLCDEIDDAAHLLFHPHVWHQFGINNRNAYMSKRGLRNVYT